jgi:hypothetical protein
MLPVEMSLPVLNKTNFAELIYSLNENVFKNR